MRLGHQPALDGLRAIAITSVVLYHATDFTFPATGLVGVDLFFVLSGFLITMLLVEEQAWRGGISLQAFYRRRTVRLLPALLVLVAGFLAVSAVTSDTREAVLGSVAGLAYAMNLMLSGGLGEEVPYALTHLWSLAAEAQFYLVWPLLLVSLQTRRAWAIWACAGAVAFTQLRAFELMSAGAPTERIEFGIDTRSLSILVGCLLALVLCSRREVGIPRVPRILALVAPIAFLALILIDWRRMLFAGPLLVAALCSSVLVVQALDRTSAVSRALSVRPVVFLGKISYSLYLWHLPILVAFGVFGAGLTLLAVPAVGLSLVAATATYYLVERPFLRRRAAPTSASPTPQPALVASTSR